MVSNATGIPMACQGPVGILSTEEVHRLPLECYNELGNFGKFSLLTSLIYECIFTILLWVFEHFRFIVFIMIFLGTLYTAYKSYWSPILYVKELTDVGFDHIPPGSSRAAKVSRSQQARRAGSKLPPPYPNGWFAVAESKDVKVGQVKAVDVLGQNLCVYRTEEGVARCMDAYCPHLGANMGVGGRVRAGCVECPFHKWRFASDGVCVSVPGQETPPKGVSVRTWPTAEADGAVWVWHHSTGSPPRWEMADAPEVKNWGYRGRNEFLVSCHVQDIPENGADVAHLNAVHSPSLLTTLADTNPSLVDFIGEHTWAGQWCAGAGAGGGHAARMQLRHHYTIGKVKLFRIDADATQLGPGQVRLWVRTALGGMLISQSVTPLSPLLQRVVHRFYSPNYNAPLVAAFIRGESYMFERDVAIWNHKRYVPSPTYVKTDKTIRAFRSWYSQFYDDNSISFADAYRKMKDPLDW